MVFVYEVSFDMVGSYKLCGWCCNVVGCYDELFGVVVVWKDIVSCFDEGVGWGCDCFCCRDEIFCLVVVFFVEGCVGGVVMVSLDNFLLCDCCCFDEFCNSVGDGWCGVENRVVDFEFVGWVIVVRFVFEFCEMGSCSGNGISSFVEFGVDEVV